MVPLMEEAINSFIMDWEIILSNKMANKILDYRINRYVTTRIIPPFYMSAYIMDTIYFNSDIPILGWKWTPQDPTPIHIYHKYFWKAHYKNHIYRIFHGFVLPVHQAIFNRPTPHLSDEASIDLTSIDSWLSEEKFTYVRPFGSNTNPHVLPLYIPDKLLSREMDYQITKKGMSRNLKESKKQMWPTFSLYYGTYLMHDFKHAKKEAEKIKVLKLAVIPKNSMTQTKWLTTLPLR